MAQHDDRLVRNSEFCIVDLTHIPSATAVSRLLPWRRGTACSRVAGFTAAYDPAAHTICNAAARLDTVATADAAICAAMP